MKPDPSFDQYAEDYDRQLERGISLSGESKDFFAEARIAWLDKRLSALGLSAPGSVMDYGCGTGSSTPYLRRWLPAAGLSGVDVSAASLQRAAREHPEGRYYLPDDYPAGAGVDMVFSNGTFHHIPPAERPGALAFIHRNLKPGGLFALWENNPWNPGTRWIMSRIEFDRDAITLSPPYARAMLRGNGFDVLESTSCFFFPAALKALRGLEPALKGIPLGAQYLVLARRAAR